MINANMIIKPTVMTPISIPIDNVGEEECMSFIVILVVVVFLAST